jgi:hypothetical protein
MTIPAQWRAPPCRASRTPAGVVELAGPELAELAAVPPLAPGISWAAAMVPGATVCCKSCLVRFETTWAWFPSETQVSTLASGPSRQPCATNSPSLSRLGGAFWAWRSFLGFAVVLTREVAPCLGHDVEAAVQRGIRLDPVEQRDLEAVDEILARRRPSEAPTGCSTKRACVRGRGRKTIGFGRRRYRRPAGAGSSQWRLGVGPQGLAHSARRCRSPTGAADRAGLSLLTHPLHPTAPWARSSPRSAPVAQLDRALPSEGGGPCSSVR